VRILIVGLAAITASLALLGAQIQHTAAQQADTTVRDQAKRTAANAAAVFDDWRNELLVAASNAALTDWFEYPDRQTTLQVQIDRQLVRLHDTYPGMIDEACYISFTGQELARQVRGVPATKADLSPDESGNPFFGPTQTVDVGTVWQNVPYISPDSLRWVVSNSTPIVVAGRKVALLHFEANLDSLRSQIARGLGPGLNARIIDVRSHEVIVDTSSSVPIVKAPLAKAGPWHGAAGPERASASVAVDTLRNGNRWVVEVSAKGPHPFTTSFLLRATGLALLALLAIAIVALNFASSIARPVNEVTDVAEALARGDLTRQSEVDRRDEIGRMAIAVNAAVTGMQEQQEAVRAAHQESQVQLAASHLEQQHSDDQVRARAQGVIDETATSVLSELSDVVLQVGQVRSGAGTIEQRTAATGLVTRALVEQAQAADRLVTALGTSLHRIGSIADLIGDVAAQTKLLALNATIESARAGQAGAAFSIVAREVKELAATTARSTGEITSTIAALKQEAGEVAVAISLMADNVANIDTATAEVTTVTGQQQATVELLHDRVSDTIGRIKSLAQRQS
jgi:methyl-accepting chemotaxis protein